MRIDLSGRSAVVSGSTAGIGLAIARGLAEAGASVVINGRTQQRVDAGVAVLKAALPGADISGIAADLATAEGATTLVAQVPDADIVVNNMGIYGRKPFFELDDADWQSYFDINVMSGVRLSRHYAQGMKARGWGRIVFISSESALHIPPDMVHYGFSKTAQLAVSRGLAEVLAGTGVTVNSVLPGPTHSETSDGNRARAAGDRGVSVALVEEEFLRTARPTTLIKRIAEPEEVANMVVYVCSPQASATTGAALRVDGGIVRTIS